MTSRELSKLFRQLSHNREQQQEYILEMYADPAEQYYYQSKLDVLRRQEKALSKAMQREKGKA